MLQKTRVLTVLAALATTATIVAAAACSGGDVAQGDYDKVKQQLQDQQTQNQQLQQQLANAPKTAASPAATGSATPAAGGATTAAAGAVTALLGAKKVPPVTPPPSPSPTPVGATAVPKATAPAAMYEPVAYSVYMETLATTHQSSFDIASTVACTPSGQFVRGQRIVFRYEVFDMSTGKRITDKDGAKLKIVFPNGDEANGSWGQRGGGGVPDAPFMWSSNWDVPKDFPLGAIAYKLVVTTKDGKSFTWAPPALSSTALKEDTRPVVVGDMPQ